ncbi:hypothetical protein CFIMG_006365RA [Ceratocystis fimbriata CBS 114723]|uniref:Uncharacterized protein n=1 Tax=Ceratocystis fimbriata CBS 114723 TaxID=1035309 RepID=A0A2C5WUX0_9PEZI|nr:hypothetical protein CFIMG_006365RA [Ceratocystis fimbriata CBS 114723]
MFSHRTASLWTEIPWPQALRQPSIPRGFLTADTHASLTWANIWPILRLVVYVVALSNRVQTGVPQYSKAFKRSRRVSLLLPMHIVHGMVQLAFFELRRMGLIANAVTLPEIAACIFWGWCSLLITKPLRRGHPPTSRAAYQLMAVVRPLLEGLSWYNKDPVPYLMSVALLDTFIWVRVQLKVFYFLGRRYNSLAYATSLPISSTISLCSWGFKPSTAFVVVMGIPLVAALDELISLVAKHRFAGKHVTLSTKHMPRSPIDLVLWGLLKLGFANIETLRGFMYQEAPEYTEPVDDEYGYVPQRLITGVPIKGEDKARLS